MKKFEKPAMEKVEFESNDVITTSGSISGCLTDCSPVCSPNCIIVCSPETK